MTEHALPVQLACRVLEVSESGYYAWYSRVPSARSIRHVWLTDAIRHVHTESRGTYGVRRVHAELTLGQSIAVGHQAVEILMRRAGIQGISGRPRFRRVPSVATAGDRVDRQFHRDHPNQLWVTDITEHPTREGKVYCAVVLDAWSRRVVGWSIDSTPTTALVNNALGMAIDQRRPQGETVIHSDQGTQFMLEDAEPDLVSFDLVQHSPRGAALDTLRRLVRAGTTIAWGVTPTTGTGGAESARRLLDHTIEGLTAARMDPLELLAASLLTASCGTGAQSTREEATVSRTLGDIAQHCVPPSLGTPERRTRHAPAPP
jgi:hypothetical protein